MHSGWLHLQVAWFHWDYRSQAPVGTEYHSMIVVSDLKTFDGAHELGYCNDRKIKQFSVTNRHWHEPWYPYRSQTLFKQPQTISGFRLLLPIPILMSTASIYSHGLSQLEGWRKARFLSHIPRNRPHYMCLMFSTWNESDWFACWIADRESSILLHVTFGDAACHNTMSRSNFTSKAFHLCVLNLAWNCHR